MQPGTLGYCPMCGHDNGGHTPAGIWCRGCKGRCVPEPEFLNTEWERLEMAARRGKISRAAGTVVPLGSEIYLWWIQIRMAYALAGSEPEHRHLFEKYLKSQSAAFRVLAARGVVEVTPKMTKRMMLVEMGETFAQFLKDCADEFPAEVDDVRKAINEMLDLFPIPFTEEDAHNPEAD